MAKKKSSKPKSMSARKAKSIVRTTKHIKTNKLLADEHGGLTARVQQARTRLGVSTEHKRKKK